MGFFLFGISFFILEILEIFCIMQISKVEILKGCSSDWVPEKNPNDTHSVVAMETLLALTP